MSTVVSYKGSNITTVNNQTIKLDTAGTWVEDDITIEDVSSSGGAAIIKDTIDEHGGTIREIITENELYIQQRYATPSQSAQNIEPTTGYNALSNVRISAIPSTYVGSGINIKSSNDLTVSGSTVTAPAGYYANAATKAVAAGSVTAPSSITGTGASISTASNSVTFTKTVSVTPNVTNAGYISSGTAGNSNVSLTASITPRNSNSLTTSGATVTAPAGYYASQSTKAISSGSEGTPTATKGAVSNHSISVTPSVTNTAGYISGGTKTGTAVTVSASELVSGSTTLTNNGTYNIANLSTAIVNVSGGGSGGSNNVQTDSVESGTSSASTLSFTGLKGEPNYFVVNIDDNVATGTPSKIVAVVYDGTSVHAQTITNTSNAQVSYDSSGVTYSYNNGTLTLTSTSASFVTNTPYFVDYVYGGSSTNVGTVNVQVGSGATSITFTGLEDEPVLWSCIFKSNFATSSGYQRVIFVEKTVQNLELGYAMDSSAHISNQYWSASYNNGSLTITSQGTNAGGYFHQPGYYQLTYVIAGSGGGGQTQTVTVQSINITSNGTYTAPTGKAYSPVTVNVSTGGTINNQNKSVSPSSATQYVSADNGYTGLGTVTVNAIPSTYVGQGITSRNSGSLTVNGATVTAPAGYYSAAATKAISAGSAGTPSASKGTVSNNSVIVTPSVTNTTGYITGGTKTGTGVTVSASELVSGSTNFTNNGTYSVTNLSSVTINVPTGSTPTLLYRGTLGTINTTSTTETTVTTINLGSSAWTYQKILYVSIWRTTGWGTTQSDYHYRYPTTAGYLGSETFFGGYAYGITQDESSSTNISSQGRFNVIYSNGFYSRLSGTSDSNQYGIYPKTLTNTGSLTICVKYNATYTTTINGDFDIAVLLLDWPYGCPWINPAERPTTTT